MRGEKVTDAQDFGRQSKGEDHFKSWFSFFSCLLVTILILSSPKTFLYISFVFFRSLIGNFFFCFLPIFDQELSLFWKCVSSSIVNDFFFLGDPIVPSSEDKDGNSHPGS